MNETKKLLTEVIEFYGADMQLNICIEEMSELIKELCKVKRKKMNKDHIAEEMADVKIIMEQLSIIFGNDNEVNEWYEKKIQRLKSRLDEDKIRLYIPNAEISF